MLGWIAGALLAVCDGLVSAELGAALPGSGGSYRYLREIYGPQKWGRLISFLFIWQVSFSAPLSIATGCIGLAGYAAYYWPELDTVYAHHDAALHIPWAGNAAGQLDRHAGHRGRHCDLLVYCAAALSAHHGDRAAFENSVVWRDGNDWLDHLRRADPLQRRAGIRFPSGRIHAFSTNSLPDWAERCWSPPTIIGVTTTSAFWAMRSKTRKRIFLGRLLLSILLVACLYLMMNLCILAVVPWREMLQAGQNNTGLYVVSLFMQRIYGSWAARLVTGLVIATAFASVFSLMLGYSRVPYAAAKDGNYFKAFAKVHPVHRFPHVSLLALGVVAAAFCFLRLKDAIAALVVIRLILQFLVQAVGVIVLRIWQPEMPRPFRMWLYPLPALLASAGFLFILFNRENWQKEVRYAADHSAHGLVIYMVRAWKDSEWPFVNAPRTKS